MATTKSSAPVYSIVIPVYNSESMLAALYERLVGTMENVGKSFEIVFVEDGGPDRSWDVLQGLAAKDPRVTAIQLMRNYGQGSALMCGLRQSRGSFVITIDDDLQTPPEEIPVLIDALESRPELDAVIGIPHEKKHPLWRRLGSKAINLVNSLVFRKKPSLKFASFRIVRRPAVDLLVERAMPQPAIGPLLYSITPRMANVYVRHEPRPAGRSGYTLAKIFSLTLSNFLGFSAFPLRTLASLGLLGIVFSAFLGMFYLVRYFTGGIGVTGWITLILILIGLSGFNFFAFGVMGEYLLRILQSVQSTPQYLVRQRVGDSRPDGAFRDAKLADPAEQGEQGRRFGQGGQDQSQ